MAQEFISCTHRMIPQFKASLVAGFNFFHPFRWYLILFRSITVPYTEPNRDALKKGHKMAHDFYLH